MSQFTKIILSIVVLLFVYFIMMTIQEATEYSNAGQTFNILVLIVAVVIIRAIWVAKSKGKNNRPRRRL
jgi:heme/copper-type cytochrome/quinol oxidase subunit 4